MKVANKKIVNKQLSLLYLFSKFCYHVAFGFKAQVFISRNASTCSYLLESFSHYSSLENVFSTCFSNKNVDLQNAYRKQFHLKTNTISSERPNRTVRPNLRAILAEPVRPNLRSTQQKVRFGQFDKKFANLTKNSPF